MRRSFMILIVTLLLILPCSTHAAQYTLSRGSVVYSDGTIIDSLQTGVSMSGTMTIDGNNITQTATVCIDYQCASGTLYGTLLSVNENYHSVTIRNANGMTSDVVLLNWPQNPIMTLVNSDILAEVDQWAPSASLQNSSQEGEIHSADSITLSTAGGTILELLDIINDKTR